MATSPKSSEQGSWRGRPSLRFRWPFSLDAFSRMDEYRGSLLQRNSPAESTQRGSREPLASRLRWPFSLEAFNGMDEYRVVLRASGFFNTVTMNRSKAYVDYVLSITGYVIAWVNKTAKSIVRKLFGLNPEFVDETDQEVNPDGQLRTKAEFVANVRKAFQGTPAERFFKNNPKFIEELAEKAASLADDPNTPIVDKDHFPKTAQVTMHQQVLYCDDSTSMKREGRWDSQNELINRIARVTTRILPEGEGVYMRYINQQVPNSDSLKFEELLDVVRPLTWGGDTPIGTNLKSKILEPLVYSKLPNNLNRPLLVSVITDGMPEPEPKSTFVDAIAECGDRLEAAGLPRESVKFMIGQVGSATAATKFLQDIGNDARIENVVFVASEKLDVTSSRLENDWQMDEWLIETLYAPIMKSEGKKNK